MNKENVLDFRTLPCPQPVVQCRNFLQENAAQSVCILVDNEPAVENVTRYLEQQGFAVKTSAEGKDFMISAQKDGASMPTAAPMQSQDDVSEEKILVLITTEHLGSGDDGLGARLMVTFLSTLPEMDKALWRIVLLNGGVKLAVEGTETLAHLQALEKAGVDVLVCGTCLNHYNLLDKKGVGATSNMLDIVTSLELAHKVIRP